MASNESFGINVTADDEPLDCPEYSEEAEKALMQFSFWCEGVVLCVLAVAGIIGNTLASIILSSKNMRNSFNLVSLRSHLLPNQQLGPMWN